MKTLKAHVERGRVVMDEPMDLPEGTALELVVASEEDDLDEAERAVMDAALDRAWASYQRGEFKPAREALKSIRHRT